MRKKTAPSTRKHRNASYRRSPGLITKGKSAEGSETKKYVLDDRSHRTALAMSRAQRLGSIGVLGSPAL
jgi:hypothetical protein